jgi:hypothetical protein
MVLAIEMSSYDFPSLQDARSCEIMKYETGKE